MNRRKSLCAALALISATTMVRASDKSIDEAAKRRNLAIAISKELRDPSSANFTLFDSESAIAGELKAEIYAQLAKGKSKKEVLDFFAQRYGDQIRYDPELKGSTVVLWMAPWLLLGVAAAVALTKARQNKKRRGR